MTYRFAEGLHDQEDFDTARRLLNDDPFLHKQVEQGIQKSKGALQSLIVAVELLASLQKSLNIRSAEPWCNLYIKAMAGQLRDSAIVKDTLLAVRKLTSDIMARLLDDLSNSPYFCRREFAAARSL